ncbi:aldo/keto reductase [soil metagenome]
MQAVNGIPILGYGTYPVTGQECTDCVLMALDAGFRHIDTAQMYGNEADVGHALAGVPRDSVFVTTKIDRGNTNKRRFNSSLARSLDDLGLSAVDLLLIHWPPDERNFNDAIDALCAAQDRKLARMIGISNFNTTLIRRAVARASLPLVVDQVEFHPLLDQSKVLAEARANGLAVTAYSPLGRGAVLRDPVIVGIARRLDRPPSEIVLRWITQQGVIAVPHTTKRANMESNLRAITFDLSDADMKAVSALGQQKRRFISPAGWATWDD